jgi:hypothetical protein
VTDNFDAYASCQRVVQASSEDLHVPSQIVQGSGGFSAYMVLGLLVLDVGLYSALAWYLDQVTGGPKPVGWMSSFALLRIPPLLCWLRRTCVCMLMLQHDSAMWPQCTSMTHVCNGTLNLVCHEALHHQLTFHASAAYCLQVLPTSPSAPQHPLFFLRWLRRRNGSNLARRSRRQQIGGDSPHGTGHNIDSDSSLRAPLLPAAGLPEQSLPRDAEGAVGAGSAGRGAAGAPQQGRHAAAASHGPAGVRAEGDEGRQWAMGAGDAVAAAWDPDVLQPGVHVRGLRKSFPSAGSQQQRVQVGGWVVLMWIAGVLCGACPTMCRMR